MERTDRIERVDSLREFTLPMRDPRYDNDMREYVAIYSMNTFHSY